MSWRLPMAYLSLYRHTVTQAHRHIGIQAQRHSGTIYTQLILYQATGSTNFNLCPSLIFCDGNAPNLQQKVYSGVISIRWYSPRKVFGYSAITLQIRRGFFAAGPVFWTFETHVRFGFVSSLASSGPESVGPRILVRGFKCLETFLLWGGVFKALFLLLVGSSAYKCWAVVPFSFIVTDQWRRTLFSEEKTYSLVWTSPSLKKQKWTGLND